MPKLFISYRRHDSADATGRLYDRLKAHFGQENVFIDLDAIPFGVDFRKHLSDAVSQCDICLAIIGDEWLNVCFAEGPHQGKRRLEDPQDYVRIEIEAALARGIPVVPVLIGQASIPAEATLPGGLKELAYRNAAVVRSGPDFHSQADRLVRGLDHLVAKKGEVKEGVQKAIHLADDDPEMALVRARKVLESAIRDVYQRRIHEPPGNRPLEILTERLFENGDLPAHLEVATVVRKLGNAGSQKMTGAEANRLFADVMEVLNWYMAVEQPDAVGEQFVRAPQKPIMGKARAAQRDCKTAVVPKGLRSFDANDARFFLELLPGPLDEHGLPESIRFWKHRIETRDEGNFTVGVVYGPSGCGKSSLVKAGLIPRLAKNVVAVYVEATSDGTESRLLHGLRKRCPDLPTDIDLTGTVAALRQGKPTSQGQKVVIVLDQFEQWLHAKSVEENSELAQASAAALSPLSRNISLSSWKVPSSHGLQAELHKMGGKRERKSRQEERVTRDQERHSQCDLSENGPHANPGEGNHATAL